MLFESKSRTESCPDPTFSKKSAKALDSWSSRRDWPPGGAGGGEANVVEKMSKSGTGERIWEISNHEAFEMGKWQKRAHVSQS